MALKISFVIPAYNHWELTHQLLFDIYNHCTHRVDEILVVNNGSEDIECYTGIQWWIGTKMLPITDLILQKNVGFLRACNIGVKEAKGDIIILISNDVRISGDITTEIHKVLVSIPKAIAGGKLYEQSTGWNDFNGKIFPYLEGWLLAFKKKDWEEIGGFDKRYEPNDFEDVDFSTAAIDKGFTLIGLDPSKTHHIGSQTIKYGPEREALTKRNKEKFKEKWIK